MVEVMASAGAISNTAVISSAFEAQVEVVFQTDIKDERFHIAQLPSGLLVPASLGRRGLSQVLNHLLELPEPTPFDFFVRIPSKTNDTEEPNVEEPGSSRVFLRSSLSKVMARHGLTSETRLLLVYVLARTTFQDEVFSNVEDWTFSLSSFVHSSGNIGTIAAASGDGVCRLYQTALDSASFLTPKNGCPSCHKVSSVSLSSVNLCSVPDTETTQVTLTDDAGYVYFGGVSSSEQETFAWSPLVKGKSDYGPLTSCVISEDGALAATAASNGRVLLWDNVSVREKLREASDVRDARKMEESDCGLPNSRKRPREDAVQDAQLRSSLLGHTSSVNDVCFPDGSLWGCLLLSGSSDQTVRLWDIPSVTTLATWPVARAVSSVTTAPDSRLFATSHEDGRVRVWDVRSPLLAATASELAEKGSYQRCSALSTYHIHRRLVSQVKWNPENANILVSVSHDGSAKVIDLRSPRFALQTVSYPDIKLLCVCWIDGSRFVSGGSDNKIRSHYTA